jgi:hypothetical protein
MLDWINENPAQSALAIMTLIAMAWQGILIAVEKKKGR